MYWSEGSILRHAPSFCSTEGVMQEANPLTALQLPCGQVEAA